MAVIQFGSIVTQGAGKIGGSVIARGRSGQVLKNKGYPIIRRGEVNQPSRSKLASVSSLWGGLTSVQRSAWEAVALSQTRYNRFGVAYTPTGYQLFCELNMNLSSFGSQAPIDVPPALPNYPSVDTWTYTVDPGASQVQIDWNYVSGDTDFDFYFSLFPLQSFGTTYMRGSARLTSAADSVNAGTINLYTEVIKRFPFLTADNAVLAVAADGVQAASGWRMPRVTLLIPYVTP